MSIVGALTSGLGNAYNYLYSCCTKRAAVTAMAVGSIAAVVWYQYSMPTPEEEEDDGYSFQEGPVNFDLFVKMMNKALEVIKGCPASNELLKEVRKNGPVVFRADHSWQRRFFDQEGNNVTIDPDALESNNLPGLVVRELVRTLPEASAYWEEIKERACTEGPGPYTDFGEIRAFLGKCLGYHQRIFDLFQSVEIPCYVEGHWGLPLSLSGYWSDLNPLLEFGGYYECYGNIPRITINRF